MTSLNVTEAEARLTELLGRTAEDGESILITRKVDLHPRGNLHG